MSVFQPNSLPAVLLGGAPNCGKSVLAYLLSAHLRRHGVAHYLLRAAPDGEGNWFLHNQGNPVVRQVRQANKGHFTPEFVAQVRASIENRLTPLLVDVGGKPRGEQFGILRACTHAVVLYREAEQRQTWLRWLEEVGVPPLAVLRSVRGEERIHRLTPVLEGDISGLEREAPRPGLTFGALLERLSGVMRYEEGQLATIHLRAAPLPPLLESDLARELRRGATPEGTPHWEPTQLPALAARVDAQRYPDGAALYGRGPLWLAAALSWMLHPAPLALFDVRFGWVTASTPGREPRPPLDWRWQRTEQGAVRLSADLAGQLITPADLWLPPDLPPQAPLLLDGKLPRWAVAALVRALAPGRPWLAVRDMHAGGWVIVAGARLGERLHK